MLYNGFLALLGAWGVAKPTFCRVLDIVKLKISLGRIVTNIYFEEIIFGGCVSEGDKHRVREDVKDAGYKLLLALDSDTKAQLIEQMRQAGLNTKYDKTKFIRTLINQNKNEFLFRDEHLEELRKNFADLARVGGLLNQLAFHLNTERVRVLDGELATVDVDLTLMKSLIDEVRQEVGVLSQEVINLSKKRVK